ncbi:hypothetical protein N665_0056s0005 [Sinapis alba]|nr:hypothetical protein N665_0056s0005 [Sinapis alba]
MRQKYFPELLFLMETMHCRNNLVDIQVWLGYDHVYTVDPEGTCGGLALFWKKSSDITFNFVDKNLLDFLVLFGGCSFFVSCVYGNPNVSKRGAVWERVTRIGIQRKQAWAMLRGFNEILNNSEKIGGPLRSDKSFEDFNGMLRECEMKDLISTGNSYSWSGWRRNQWIQCKLDRCFGNKASTNLFPSSSQTFIEKRGSYHRPILLSLKSFHEHYRGSFRFDSRMLNNDENCLLAKFLKSRYFDEGTFESAQISDRPSYGWRIILFGKELLDEGLTPMIGNGKKNSGMAIYVARRWL